MLEQPMFPRLELNDVCWDEEIERPVVSHHMPDTAEKCELSIVNTNYCLSVESTHLVTIGMGEVYM